MLSTDPKSISALGYRLIEEELGPGAFDDVDFIAYHNSPEHNDFIKKTLARDIGGCYEVRFNSSIWLVFTHA